jgi:HEAT repeat protein
MIRRPNWPLLSAPGAPAALLALAAAAALALASALAARAGDPPRRADPLEALAEKCRAPLEVLREVKAERLLSNDPNARRALLKEIAAEPRQELFGLVAHMADADKDPKTAIAALGCISGFALLADRDEALRVVRPLAERGIGKGGQFARHGIEEVQLLTRWFRWDAEIAPFLKGVFEGNDFNLRSFAFRAICDLKNPKVVEDLVRPAAWGVYRSTKVSLFDRREAIRTLVEMGDRGILPELQKNLRGDGRVAVVSAWSLTRMRDPSSLEELRRIDSTAVHALRKPCWIARCLLDDPLCLEEIERVVSDKNEHAEIKRSFTAALGEMTGLAERAKGVLEKLWSAEGLGEGVKVGAALGLLNLGDARGVALLEKRLAGPWADDPSLRFQGHAWMCQLRFMDDILRVRNKEVGPLLVAMTKVAAPEHKDRKDKDGKEKQLEWWRRGYPREELLPDWYAEYAADAVSQCGEHGLEGTLPRLQELSAFEEPIGHLKFHAFVSRYELGDKRALGSLQKFLPYYDDSITRDFWLSAGQVEIRTSRLKWSTIFDVCAKEERLADPSHTDLLEVLLKTRAGADDPMAEGWARRVGGGRGPEGTLGREERSPLERPPETSYLVRNQFVRRAIALAAGRIAGEKAAPQLARALRDSRAVVRAAALEEIGRISGRYALFVGATEAEEHAVHATAVAWLKEQGAWPE